MKSVFRTMVFFLLMFAVATPAAAADAPDKTGWPDEVRFVSGPTTGNWFKLGDILAELWTKEVIKSSSAGGGGVSNVLKINAREAEVGFTITSFLGAALKGEGAFAGKNIDNAVILNNIYTQVTYFVLRKDFAEKNNVKTVGDLLKQQKVRFATLAPGSGADFAVRSLFKFGYNTEYDSLKEKGWELQTATFVTGEEMITSNKTDCFAFSVGRFGPLVKKIEDKIGVVILAVEQDALNAVAEQYGTITHEIKPGIYKSVTEPTKTLGDYTCIVVRKDLPENLVFLLNKAMWDNKKALAEKITDVQELTPATALPKGIPSHPGSEKFWNSLK